MHDDNKRLPFEFNGGKGTARSIRNITHLDAGTRMSASGWIQGALVIGNAYDDERDALRINSIYPSSSIVNGAS